MTAAETAARLRDLIGRAKRTGFFTCTDFLDEQETAEALSLSESEHLTAMAWGGADFCTRKMVRFGEEGSFGDPGFPLRVLRISPKGEKFACEMTHRDYLGAMLHLGIERSAVGDLYIDGKTAYTAVSAPLAEFVCTSLLRVGRVAVVCDEVAAFPPHLAPKTEEVRLTVSSLRLDAVLSHLYHLSREDGQQLFLHGQVFCFGRPVLKNTYTPKEGDVISVRGYGKFVIRGFPGETKKGRIVVLLDRFV